MTHDRPVKLPLWAYGLLKATFLMALGYVGNQFWLIPVQQQRQDDAIRAQIERQDRDEKLLQGFAAQHNAMIRDIEKLNHKVDDLTKTMEDHERRERLRSKGRS